MNNFTCVKSCVEKYRESTQFQELELRLGHYENGKFTAGVERAVFEQLLEDMQNSPLQCNGKWSEELDYFYTHRNINTRTRVGYDSAGIKINVEHIQKENIQNVILSHAVNSSIACKVSLSLEKPVTNIPGICIPSHVRIKQKKTFKDIRDGKVIWIYELSKTWSAGSRSVVEQMQHMSPPTYEVECELVDEDGTYSSNNDDDYMAKSILLKTQTLMGDDGMDDQSIAVVSISGQMSASNKRKRSSNSSKKTTSTDGEWKESSTSTELQESSVTD